MQLEKFKAKTKNGDIWISGDLDKKGDIYTITNKDLKTPVEVISSTLCEYVGLDKDGNDVFLNDTIIFSGYDCDIEKKIVRGANGFLLYPKTNDMMISLSLIGGKGRFKLKDGI